MAVERIPPKRTVSRAAIMNAANFLATVVLVAFPAFLPDSAAYIAIPYAVALAVILRRQRSV